MDRIKNKTELLHSDISENIIGCCFEVMIFFLRAILPAKPIFVIFDLSRY